MCVDFSVHSLFSLRIIIPSSSHISHFYSKVNAQHIIFSSASAWKKKNYAARFYDLFSFRRSLKRCVAFNEVLSFMAACIKKILWMNEFKEIISQKYHGLLVKSSQSARESEINDLIPFQICGLMKEKNKYCNCGGVWWLVLYGILYDRPFWDEIQKFYYCYYRCIELKHKWMDFCL